LQIKFQKKNQSHSFSTLQWRMIFLSAIASSQFLLAMRRVQRGAAPEVKMAKNNKSETPKTPRLVRNSNSKVAASATAPMPSYEIPRPPQPASDPDSFERLNELIRIRAYELYERRGRGDGLEAQDWLQAEEEVMEQYRKRTA
jgi:hypothetical protein